MLTSLLRKATRPAAKAGAAAQAPARHRAWAWVGLPMLLAGCEMAVDVPEPEHTPGVALQLTLDNLMPDDSARRTDFVGRRPFVSVSQRLRDQRPLDGRDDATVEVSDAAGRVVERYRPAAYFGQPGTYRPTLRYQFRPGEEYRVRASVPGIAPAESRLTLPPEVPVQATVTPLSSNSGQSRMRVTVSFDEPGGTADHYLAVARLVDQQGQPAGFLDLEEDAAASVAEYRLSEAGSTYNLYPFSDANVNGRRLSFSNVVTYYANNPGGPLYLEITLSHLTRDLFLFYNSLVQYTNNDGNPFAEPTPLYSNVQPGFGIFGGATDASVRVPL
ncbi:hypothetical protein GCM10027048_25110 [Hymenobacter coalescens]